MPNSSAVVAQSIPELLNQHAKAISLVKNYLETQHFPDLRENSSLASPISSAQFKVDDLFYLRYILSAKISIDEETDLGTHETIKHIQQVLVWRKQFVNKSGADNLEKTEAEMQKRIPMHKTGTLWNHFPVIVLPFDKIDFDWIFAQVGNDSKSFEEKLFNFFLLQKEKTFIELDVKSRETNTLVKAVTVYDLNGMSFSSIYRLTKFLKVVQKQQKKIKAFFPQSTHSTVILNSPGQWVLKSLSGSKKQRIMDVNSFLDEFDARRAVPQFIGGYISWPKDSLKPVDPIDDLQALKKLEPKLQENQVEKSTVPPQVSAQDMSVKNVLVQHAKKVKKVDLGVFERECVFMKKNKLFSMKVLEPNQIVNLYFTNLKSKDAHVLFAIKENGAHAKWEFAGQKGSKRLHPGFNHYQMRVLKPAEVVMIYVDHQIFEKVGQDFDLEAVYLKQKNSKTRRVKNIGKKILKSTNSSSGLGANASNGKRRKQSFSRLFSASQDESESQFTNGKELYFKFDVSKSVVPGSFGGHDEETVEHIGKLGVSVNSKNQPGRTSMSVRRLKRQETRRVMEDDNRSVMTLTPEKDDSPAFFSAVGQILGFIEA